MSLRSKKYLVCVAAFALALAGVGAASGARVRPGRRFATLVGSGVEPGPAGRPGVSRRLPGLPRWRDAAGVTAVASAVSDPNSASYGRYLSAAEFRARFSPARADVDAVRRWLGDAGLRVDSVPASRLWVAASGSARVVERALGTGLAMYRTGTTVQRATTGDPRVPAELAGIVKGFVGLSDVRMRTGISNRLPKPPAFKNGRPCSTFWGEKVADDLPPAYGAPAPFSPCGYSLAGSPAFRDIVDPPSPMAAVRTDSANFLTPHQGQLFTLRSLNQTGTLHTTPGYDAWVLRTDRRSWTRCPNDGRTTNDQGERSGVHAPAARLVRPGPVR